MPIKFERFPGAGFDPVSSLQATQSAVSLIEKHDRTEEPGGMGMGYE